DTDDSSTTRSKFFRSKKKTHTVGRQRGPESGCRTEKRPRRSRALQKLEVNRLLKDYGESSCSGACVEPIKDTDLSELLPETEALIREREFVDIGIQCDLEFYWFDVLQKSTASVDTQVEVVTTEAEVQCEIINLPSVPTCSTPLCSPVK
ncbi:unnamed protein product, partial [Pocillopora meandrina]